MIEFVTLLLIILFFIYLVSYITSVPVFLINITIILLIIFRAKVDIKKYNMELFYLIGAIITTIIFILSSTLTLWLIEFMSSLLIEELTQALLLTFIFAHLFQLLYVETKKFRD